VEPAPFDTAVAHGDFDIEVGGAERRLSAPFRSSIEDRNGVARSTAVELRHALSSDAFDTEFQPVSVLDAPMGSGGSETTRFTFRQFCGKWTLNKGLLTLIFKKLRMIPDRQLVWLSVWLFNSNLHPCMIV
jgi:hypothetical protein